MRAGALRNLITLQAPVGVSDGIGGLTTTWTDQATVNANIEPVSAKVQLMAQQNLGAITHTIELRYTAVGIKSSWRVKFGTRYFALIAPPINVFERNRDLQLLCKEVT